MLRARAGGDQGAAAGARGELGHHYRLGWDAGNQQGRPHFDAPVHKLPAQPVPGDLAPLRSGRAAYGQPAAPAASATGAGR